MLGLRISFLFVAALLWRIQHQFEVKTLECRQQLQCLDLPCQLQIYQISLKMLQTIESNYRNPGSFDNLFWGHGRSFELAMTLLTLRLLWAQLDERDAQLKRFASVDMESICWKLILFFFQLKNLVFKESIEDDDDSFLLIYIIITFCSL